MLSISYSRSFTTKHLLQLISLNSSLPELYTMQRIYYDSILCTAGVWMSLKQMSLLCTSDEHLPHCTFLKKKIKMQWCWGDCITDCIIWENTTEMKMKNNIMLCLWKYRKNPFLILDHRALVEVLHVCLLPPQRVFLHFFSTKVSKANPPFLRWFFFFS